MTALEQEARVTRGLTETYTWTEGPNGAWICETSKGDEYLVWEDGTCLCHDWQYRVSKDPEARCKHGIALGAKLVARVSAANWLANLDTTAIREHLAQAAVEDAADELTELRERRARKAKIQRHYGLMGVR